MPTIALKVQGNGAYQQIQNIVGASFAYQAVDDSDGTGHDSDATYVRLRNIGPDTGTVSFVAFQGISGFLPQSITVNVVAKRNAGGNPEIDIGLQRAGTFALSGVTFLPGAGYTLESRIFGSNGINPLTGAAWAVGDLVGVELCIVTEPGSAGSNRITLVSGSLDYAPLTNRRSRIPNMQVTLA
ncbi:MAG TPA: hypothetical protein VKF61_06495 [Candidatus Polarisedimenticolia bacterium]|nr:hypothetical protein [Candidatus Polarisedimenticolia bacterium]